MIGVGGSATTDAGTGILHELGYRFLMHKATKSNQAASVLLPYHILIQASVFRKLTVANLQSYAMSMLLFMGPTVLHTCLLVKKEPTTKQLSCSTMD